VAGLVVITWLRGRHHAHHRRKLSIRLDWSNDAGTEPDPEPDGQDSAP